MAGKKTLTLPKKVSVVGLGKLGACLAATLASKGFKVLGYDINATSVDLVNEGKAPVSEPLLSELITKSKKNISATTDHTKLVAETDTTFIIVPTPSKKDGNFSNDYLVDVLTKLGEELKKKKTHHTFIINSTVTPTTTDTILIPLLEKISKKKINKDFSICYNPEFIALGDVVNGILNPDVVLIGESNESAGALLEKIYKKLCDNDPRIARMSIVSAEIMKIALNSFVTMKISFANTLGRICEAIPGANVDAITSALGADKRISKHYIKAGLPFGGPCFPRDNRAFHAFASSVGVEAPLALATDKARDLHLTELTKKLTELIVKNKHKAISVLGLSYKPNTGVIEESASAALVEKLLAAKHGITISVYDSLALDEAKKKFGDTIVHAASPKASLEATNFWIIASPEKHYLEAIYKQKTKKGLVIIDGWRVLDKTKLPKGAKYFAVGDSI